jgi:pilus assembly protein Flp/PilA
MTRQDATSCFTSGLLLSGDKYMTKAFIRGAARLLRKEEEGATMVEYAFMLALIAAVCIGAVTILGTQTSAIFQQIQGSL